MVSSQLTAVREKRRPYVVLLTELLAERGAEDVATDARGSTKVRLARLAPRGVEGCQRSLLVLVNEKRIEDVQLFASTHFC